MTALMALGCAQLFASSKAEEVKDLYYQGVDQYVNHRNSEAIESWEKVLALEPGHADAATNIKRARIKMAAEKAFSSQISVDIAIQVKALYYKGVDQYVNDHAEVAIATWEELLKLDPAHGDAIKNIARAKAKLRALQQLDDGSDPDGSRSVFDEGVDAYFEGRLEEAVEKFQRCLQLKPGEARAMKAMKKAMENLEEQKQRRKEFERLSSAGMEAYGASMYAVATDLFAQSLMLDPTDAHIAGLMHECKERHLKAAKESERLYFKGVDAFASSKTEKALEFFKSAALLDEGNTKAQESLRRTYAKLVESKKLK